MKSFKEVRVPNQVNEESRTMSLEETTQKDVLIKTDPFYLKVVDGASEGVYLYDNIYRVIFIDLKSKYFKELLEGKFRIPLSGTTVEGVNVGVKYVITFGVDQDEQLVMEYRYADEDHPETFVSRIRVLSEVSKDRTYLTTSSGGILKTYTEGDTLGEATEGVEDGEIYVCRFRYKHKNNLDFIDITANVVKNNSIITISGPLITYIHTDDLIQPPKEKTKEVVSDIKVGDVVRVTCVKFHLDDMNTDPNIEIGRLHKVTDVEWFGWGGFYQLDGLQRGWVKNHWVEKVTETEDPTKVMMTAEEARIGSNTVLLNTFSHLNDKVAKAVEEGKRFIDIKPNTIIPTEVKSTVLQTLREDLGYKVEVSFSDEIRISW